MLIADIDPTHVLIGVAVGFVTALTTLIQVAATILQSWWLRRQQRPSEQKVQQVYQQVNNGRMERLESDVTELKKIVAAAFPKQTAAVKAAADAETPP